jgi:hypothetical protein
VFSNFRTVERREGGRSRGTLDNDRLLLAEVNLGQMIIGVLSENRRGH